MAIHAWPFVDEVAIVGDIHGEWSRLDAALQAIARIGPALPIWAVGDVLDGGTDEKVAACIAALQASGVTWIRGNHERWFLTGQSRALGHATRVLPLAAARVLTGLSSTCTFASPMGNVRLCHGFGDDDLANAWPTGLADGALDPRDVMSRLLQDRIDWVVCGHTHRPGVYRLGEFGVINAGALRPHRDPCWVHVNWRAKCATFHRIAPAPGLAPQWSADLTL